MHENSCMLHAAISNAHIVGCSIGRHPTSASLAAGVRMRCVLHTVISNVHIVGCSQGQVSPYGLLFEGGRGHVEIQISQCWGFYLDTGEPQNW